MPRTTLAVLTLALFASVATCHAAEKPVKVFILAGQSNMEGKAKISLMEYQLAQPKTSQLFAHLRDSDEWIVRDDVWIKFLDRKGNLTVGYGSPDRVGPELDFGVTVGNHFDEQVLIIKTAWGGKSLYRDFCPPSAGEPAPEILDGMLKNARKKNPDATMADIREPFGFYYRAMCEEVADTLKNLEDHFPAYEGQGYELAGFVWFQGWNDMVNADYTAAYAENMAHFIRDVRRDMKAPNLPFVIGQLGVGGTQGEPNEKRDAFKNAQAAAADLPEFQGNVAVVRTDAYWDATADAVFRKGWRDHVQEWETVGSDYPFHYLGSGKTFCAIGRAFGQAVLELQGETK